MFYFKSIKIFSLIMKEIGAYYTTLQQQKDLKGKKENPHKSYLIFGSRMFSVDVHVCICIGLSIHPLTHQFIHPSSLKCLVLPLFFIKACLSFIGINYCYDFAISLELFVFASIFGTVLHSLFSSLRCYPSLLPVTALSQSP